jgi:hypothetical protein
VLNKDGRIVCQKHGEAKYKLDFNCTYEDESNILQLDWSTSYPGIFEHIGLKSGGTEYYDPSMYFPTRTLIKSIKSYI